MLCQPSSLGAPAGNLEPEHVRAAPSSTEIGGGREGGYNGVRESRSGGNQVLGGGRVNGAGTRRIIFPILGLKTWHKATQTCTRQAQIQPAPLSTYFSLPQGDRQPVQFVPKMQHSHRSLLELGCPSYWYPYLKHYQLLVFSLRVAIFHFWIWEKMRHRSFLLLIRVSVIFIERSLTAQT